MQSPCCGATDAGASHRNRGCRQPSTAGRTLPRPAPLGPRARNDPDAVDRYRTPVFVGPLSSTVAPRRWLPTCWIALAADHVIGVSADLIGGIAFAATADRCTDFGSNANDGSPRRLPGDRTVLALPLIVVQPDGMSIGPWCDVDERLHPVFARRQVTSTG